MYKIILVEEFEYGFNTEEKRLGEIRFETTKGGSGRIPKYLVLKAVGDLLTEEAYKKA